MRGSEGCGGGERHTKVVSGEGAREARKQPAEYAGAREKILTEAGI